MPRRESEEEGTLSSIPSGERFVPRRWLALLLSGCFAWLSGCASGLGRPGASSAGTTHALIGAQAPEFELRDVVAGGMQSPRAHAGKVVIVDFWATWCAPCKQSFPVYQRLVDQMNGQLVVVAVSQDDDASGIAAFRSETGAEFPVVWDEGKAVAKRYDPPSMPTAYLIDKAGIVRLVHVGYRPGDDAVLETEVRRLAH